MSIRNAAEIDNNFFIPKNVIREGLIYYDAKSFDVYGVKYNDGIYRRMVYEEAKRVSDAVAAISSECAGGRIRFATDSPYVAISVKYRSVAKVPNYSFSATLGFDLYSGSRFIGCYVPSLDTVDTFESVIDLQPPSKEAKKYTLNFPVASEISELYIGVKKGSVIKKASPYSIKTPVVFYGSSVTQGACASRPGNTYANMVSRKLDCDYLNLGFWGNAMGEEAMANYIADLEASAFVYDYDYNAPSAEHLRQTHERAFKIIREKNPTLPIIILSAPKYYLSQADRERLEIIEATYKNAVARGDKLVRFISGKRMMEPVKDVALADNIHPGDCGFASMAGFISEALEEFFKS